jgi:hypothetical protein
MDDLSEAWVAQSGQPKGAAYPGRMLLELSASTARQRAQASKDRCRSTRHRRDRLEGANKAERPLSRAVAQGKEEDGRRHCSGARAGRLHLGHPSPERNPSPLAGLNRTSKLNAGSPAPGPGPAKLTQRARAGMEQRQGNSRGLLDSRSLRSTAARRQGQPQTDIRNCWLKPAHQSLITDVFQLRPHPCTSSRHRAHPCATSNHCRNP